METNRLRLMICGRPKSGKTGSLCALLNAGFEVGILDFDGNRDPLLTFTNPDKLTNLSVITLQDVYRFGAPNGGKEFVQLAGEPRALAKAFMALDNWSKFDPDHDWGPVKTWGRNRVLVLDSLTSQGQAAYNRVCYINGRTPGTVRDRDYSLAMNDQEAMLAKLVSSEFQCHVITLAHLKIIGPRIERGLEERGADEDLIEAKIAISKANAESIPTRYYPSALGRALPQQILRHTPASVIADVDQETGVRKFYTHPNKNIMADIGVPGKIKAELPLETGLLDIMYAVTGQKSP